MQVMRLLLEAASLCMSVYTATSTVEKKACELPSGNALYLTKFFKDECTHCQRIAPHMNEIGDRLALSDSHIRMKSMNCDECACDALDVVAVPTLILSRGKEEISRLRGYADYDAIAKFIADNVDVPIEVFTRSRSSDSHVITLYERDFYSGFNGPWLILFYSKKKDPLRDVLARLAVDFSGRINIGEISEGNAVNLTHRFNIQTYPAIIGIYNGILAGYNSKQTYEDLHAFANRLIMPSFKEIDLAEFERVVSEDPSPVFVVFYSSLGLANSFYRKAAHEYKLRARIFKSKDPALFARASIYPKKADEEAKDEEKVILTVFKDNVFHRCPHPLTSPQEIAEWLFNSHFPNVTRITNDNFYTIFHGIKPAVVLLTQNDEHVDLLEDAAQRINTGLPFNEQVISVLDTGEFSLFVPALLPGLRTPVMVIYEPQRQLFFTKHVRFSSAHFYDDLLSLINDYFEGKLRPYPYQTSIKKYVFVFLFIAVLAYLVSYKIKKRRINKGD